MSVELKILVPYDEWKLLKKIAKTHEGCKDRSTEEWDRLKTIEKEHEKCKEHYNNKKTHGLATAEGSGYCVNESGDHKGNEYSMVMPSSISHDQKNIDSDSGSFEKQVIVDKAIEIPSTTNSIKSLSKSDVIQHLQEKYKVEASSLLDNLSEHPRDFSYDANGIVSIFGTAYPGDIFTIAISKIDSTKHMHHSISGCTIFEILPVTFYSIGRQKKDIIGIDKWLELLKKYNLMDFVKNNSLKEKTSDNDLEKWYFLGPIS